MTEIPKSEEEYQEILASLPEEHRESFERLMGTLRPWEELLPELRECIVETPIGPMVKHPLVYEGFYAPGTRDGMLNKMLRDKQEACSEALRNQHWNTYVFLHERPYRLHAFSEIAHLMDDCDYWKLLSSIWSDTENARQNYGLWAGFFSSARPCREAMMTEDEQKFLADLPEEFEIYRGYRSKHGEYTGHQGFSWTLSYKKALWFARRFADAYEGEVPGVATGRVQKDHVIAFLDGRSEKEIVVLPMDVKIENEEEING